MCRAIIVNPEHNYVSYGHQRPTSDNFETDPHATVKALIKACRREIEGSTLFLWRYPCFECAKAIVYARIAKVVYKYEDNSDPTHQEAKMFLEQSGIEVIRNENLDF